MKTLALALLLASSLACAAEQTAYGVFSDLVSLRQA